MQKVPKDWQMMPFCVVSKITLFADPSHFSQGSTQASSLFITTTQTYQISRPFTLDPIPWGRGLDLMIKNLFKTSGTFHVDCKMCIAKCDWEFFEMSTNRSNKNLDLENFPKTCINYGIWKLAYFDVRNVLRKARKWLLHQTRLQQPEQINK